MCTAAFGVTSFSPSSNSLINETKAVLLRRHPRLDFQLKLKKFEATLTLFAQKKDSNRTQTNQA